MPYKNREQRLTYSRTHNRAFALLLRKLKDVRRDDREKLWDGVKQIYGHSRGNIRKHGDSYCIDVGGTFDGNLAGIWLPEMKVVAIGPDAEEFEREPHESTS